MHTHQKYMTWDKWANGILGLWVAVSAFFGFTAEVMQINLVVSGFLIAVISFLTAESMAETRRHAHT